MEYSQPQFVLKFFLFLKVLQPQCSSWTDLVKKEHSGLNIQKSWKKLDSTWNFEVLKQSYTEGSVLK